MGYLSDHYRPEQHYMRGPGPKWLEKHAGHFGRNAVPRDAGHKAAQLLRIMALMLRRRLPTGWHS
jgi:hypothetical protein